MSDTWSDYSACWADVYDDDHEEMQACEALPDPGSALELCAMHQRELTALKGSARRPRETVLTRHLSKLR